MNMFSIILVALLAVTSAAEVTAATESASVEGAWDVEYRSAVHYRYHLAMARGYHTWSWWEQKVLAIMAIVGFAGPILTSDLVSWKANTRKRIIYGWTVIACFVVTSGFILDPLGNVAKWQQHTLLADRWNELSVDAQDLRQQIDAGELAPEIIPIMVSRLTQKRAGIESASPSDDFDETLLEKCQQQQDRFLRTYVAELAVTRQ